MTLFSSNYIGTVFSVHVEPHFYTRFFHSLPFLAWTTPYIAGYCLTVLFNIELMFNQKVNPLSSFVLFGTNLLLLWIVTKYYKEELDYVARVNNRRAKPRPKQSEQPSAESSKEEKSSEEAKPKSE